MTINNLKEKVKNLPLSPGVYLMKDAGGHIIYVGKAKRLKNRVQSYFRNPEKYPPKVKKLINHLKDFDYLLTDTEFEAFMLECKLIKELQPAYNRLMKNPQSFIYIAIDRQKACNQIEVTYDCSENDGKLYFGPYTRRSTVEKAIEAIKRCFKINCSNSSRKNSPCLNYSLGLCIGMCFQAAALQQYNEIIEKIITFLQGKDERILEELKEMMETASEEYDFEAASMYRDTIQAIMSLLEKEKVIEFTENNNNIIVAEYLTDTTLKVFLIKRTTVLFHCNYVMENHSIEEIGEEIKTHIFDYFRRQELLFPKDVSKNELDDAQIIYHYLQEDHCRYLLIPDNWLETECYFNMDALLHILQRDKETENGR